MDSSFLRIHRKCLGPDIAVAWGQTSKVVSTCDNGRKSGVAVAVAWLARSFTTVCTLVSSDGANRRHSYDAILRAPSLSLSLPTSVRMSLALSNNDRHTTAKPVCKTSSGAVRILRAGVLAHIFPSAAATGFKTAYLAIVTRDSLGISKWARPSQSAS